MPPLYTQAAPLWYLCLQGCARGLLSHTLPLALPHPAPQYCDGGDLSHYIAKHAPLPEAQIANFINQVALALGVLRAKAVVHRDLKPQNLLLSGPPDQLVVKIADFGFARQLAEQDMAATFCGSPLYMAPEVLEGDQYNAKADLWSVVSTRAWYASEST